MLGNVVRGGNHTGRGRKRRGGVGRGDAPGLPRTSARPCGVPQRHPCALSAPQGRNPLFQCRREAQVLPRRGLGKFRGRRCGGGADQRLLALGAGGSAAKRGANRTSRFCFSNALIHRCSTTSTFNKAAYIEEMTGRRTVSLAKRKGDASNGWDGRSLAHLSTIHARERLLEKVPLRSVCRRKWSLHVQTQRCWGTRIAEGCCPACQIHSCSCLAPVGNGVLDLTESHQG